MSWATSSPGMAISASPKKEHDSEEEDGSKYPRPPSQRKRVVVVGLGMVGIAFMYVSTPKSSSRQRRMLTNVAPYREKILKLDAKRREYDVIVIGEEPHLAYNRVGLTSFFQHRKVENLYLNPEEWVRITYWRSEKMTHSRPLTLDNSVLR